MDRRIKVLAMIAQDARDDAENFDGKPLTGKNVAEYFGNHGASIAALAEIVKSILLDKEKKHGDGQKKDVQPGK